MSNESQCYCGSELGFQECCEKYILGYETAPSALALMKSRYAAYATQNVAYLMKTTQDATRRFYSQDEILKWATENQWKRLEIIHFSETIVAFKAHFLDSQKRMQIHNEKSVFVKEDGHWFYVEGFELD